MAGQGDAPQQYRIGVLWICKYVLRVTHGQVKIWHQFAVLDGISLLVGVLIGMFLLSRSRLYSEASNAVRWGSTFLSFAVLTYFMAFLFNYHKPETVPNFACIAVAGALVAGKPRLPAAFAVLGVILVSAYLATIRADSAFALDVGIVWMGLFPGGRAVAYSRTTQVVAGVLGGVAGLGVEFYIQRVMFPHAAFVIPIFQLWYNLGPRLIGFTLGLFPWFVMMRLAARHWQRLESWECALMIAAMIEFLMFLVVAMVNEVRLFLPYPMALIPTCAILLTIELIGNRRDEDPQALGDGAV